MSEQENKVIRSVTMTTNMEVPISLGTLEYIAGINPKETWAAVSTKDMPAKEYDELRKSHFDMISEKEKTKDFQIKLKEVLDESIRLYQAMLSRNGEVMKPYIEGRTFNFIIGMPRTGGTTLYQALSDAYGWPWENLLLSMTHNTMPNGRFCVNAPASEFDMGWRLPGNFNSLLFEFCQFLVYVNNTAPDSEDIFLKSTVLSYCTKFLNFVFGDKANYFVTVRHPGAITLTGGKEEYTREDHMQTMGTWANLYSSILRDCRPLGKLQVVEYGEGLTNVINKVFEHKKLGERAEETAFFEYEDYDKEFYESASAQEMFEYVKNTWRLFDADFPIPDRCI